MCLCAQTNEPGRAISARLRCVLNLRDSPVREGRRHTALSSSINLNPFVKLSPILTPLSRVPNAALTLSAIMLSSSRYRCPASGFPRPVFSGTRVTSYLLLKSLPSLSLSLTLSQSGLEIRPMGPGHIIARQDGSFRGRPPLSAATLAARRRVVAI